jgi:hypothetical protein
VFVKLFKKSSDELIVGGHTVDVLSIIRDGRVLLTSRTAKSYAKDHIERRIIEIMFGTNSGNPFFAYYLCPAFYAAAVGPAGAAAFGGHSRTEQFRMAVSENIARFLVVTLEHRLQVNLRSEITSFSHNRARTNVLAYVESQRGWFPIQHRTDGDEEPAHKVERVNRGRTDITDLLAIEKLSPFESRW